MANQTDRTMYVDIARTPNIMFELGSQLALDNGDLPEAFFWLAALEWKLTAYQLARTPLWRVFKQRRLFRNLRLIELELSYLKRELDKKEASRNG